MSAGRARRWLLGLGLAVGLVVAATATPAQAHVSFPWFQVVGFEPNRAGGSGLDGAPPPYAPGSRQTVFLLAPYEAAPPFNGSDDTTVDLRITVPAGFTSPACGQARKILKDDATAQTPQPGTVVSGWTCAVEAVAGRSVVHFAGPQVVDPVTKVDSAQYFSFDITVPAPTTQTTYGKDPGTEGFRVDQRYASGSVWHWIPSGVDDEATQTFVAAGLLRTVGGRGSAFHAVSPTRILDSRSGPGWQGKLAAGTPRQLVVTGGPAAVPATADAVVVNVTVTDSDANSFLTVSPTGTPAPTASNLNFATNETIPNLVTVKVGAGGQITFDTSTGATNVIADLVGYYDSGATERYNPLTPVRILDSRAGTGFAGPVTAATPRTLTARAGGVAATATSVVLNVTVTDSSTNSFLTVYPTGSGAPNASNLNFGAGQTIANLVTVPLGTNGRVDLAVDAGSVQVIADVVGYFDPTKGDRFIPLAPARILDSRTSDGGWSSTPLTAGADRTLQVQGVGGVRFDATSVVANATVTGGSANSYLTVFPSGQTLPGVSNLNFAAGQTIPNLTSVKLGAGGQITFDNHVGATHVIYDVVGFYAPAA